MEEPIKNVNTNTNTNTNTNANLTTDTLTSSSISIELQLGDVIEITSPLNQKFDNNIYIIDYIDSNKMNLINTDTFNKETLKITPDGIIGNGSITKITILSRSDELGYARQHDLLPNTWVNIYFGGDFPIIITGEITNLEEDMIEIRTIDSDVIYINFEYKGLPEDLPIESIEIRNKPSAKNIQTVLEEEQEKEKDTQTTLENLDEEEAPIETIESDKIQFLVPTNNVKNQLREIILRADQITYGDEELGPVVQFVDVFGKSQRYSIDAQVADLLDELLSTIPNSQRTSKVLNNIHLMIERFKQLREHFSTFDIYGNINGVVVREANYKPLYYYFENFKHNLYWILPVVKNIKKVYDVEDVNEENTDVQNILLETDINSITTLLDNYKSNTLPIGQNKYSTLYNELNPYFTPFELINEESVDSVIIEKPVATDINVIIDNLEDMYSSIFSNTSIKNRRFVIQKYNLGVTKLNTIEEESSNSRNITKRVKITNPDTMSIKSLLTLPEPAIRFSKINLPGTNALEKANLNLQFLNYWELLKKKTTVNNVIIDDLNGEIDFNENNFANNIKNYIINLSPEDTNGVSKLEIYNKFVSMIIPKTKVLFNLMKKFITGKLSIIDVVSYLEPFLVYADDLTYFQYVEITRFINEQISEHNKRFIDKSRVFSILNKIKSEPLIFTKAYSLISVIHKTFNYDVFSAYGIEVDKDSISAFTKYELLRKILIRDYGNLYATALTYSNIPLMFPNDITGILNNEKDTLMSQKEDTDLDTCKTIVISKYYTSLEELTNDNNRVIYFDKKYDRTNYGLLDSEYAKELLRLSPEELQIHITNDLISKKYSEYEANYLANTLLDGHKRVIDGQYAILYKGYNLNTKEEIDYYVRKNNKWVLDNEMPEDINTDESSILCDLQQSCVNVPGKIDDTCESIQSNKLSIQTKLLNNVLNEFDNKYRISKEELEKTIRAKYAYYIDILSSLKNIESAAILKYNNQKYKLGVGFDENRILNPISPYLPLLNLILGQRDFIKKQNDIIRFVNTYTRPARTETKGIFEDIYWLYCLKTDTPLLPTFKFELATTYITNKEEYRMQLEIIKSKIGKLSDDGDWWCDEHSGWPICPVSFDTEEGYEEGFKVSTRSVLEEDAGKKIASAISIIEKVVYDTPETKMINNIINALSIAMGINIEIQKEFIMNGVLKMLRDTLESEPDYKNRIKQMAEKNKKIPSYKEFYNTAILYYTSGYFLIAVQTVRPSVKTRKTHPGCIRSFNGFPFESADDLSSVNYLGCIIYDIRESGEPWNVLKGKKKDIIIGKLKASIDVLIQSPDVKRLFEEKTEYLLLNTGAEIPIEHDISTWIHFLPPLIKFELKHLMNVSTEFTTSLLKDLRTGSPNQREKLLVIDSKIIHFSLAIQECIQKIVQKNQLILHNSNNEPYLENSCCDSQDEHTAIGYFAKQNTKITEYNDIVTRLTNILADVESHTKCGLFYSNNNTKNIYPPISNNFDEKIVYMSFINFCKFNSLIPIHTDFLPLCTDKPSTELFLSGDTTERIIQKLKDDGRIYTNEQFLRLLQLIGRHNSVNMRFNSEDISYAIQLANLLNRIREEHGKNIESELIALILSALNTSNTNSKTISPAVRNLNNYLIKNIDIIKKEIIDFIKKHNGPNVTKRTVAKTIKTIENLSVWATDTSTHNENIKISDERVYNIINFYKMFIENFSSVFPNIILNKVNYDNVTIPKYHNFSGSHMNKLKTKISEYYGNLKMFYGVSNVTNILNTIQTMCTNIWNISKVTPAFTSVKTGEGIIMQPIFDERTSKYLYEYYLLTVFLNYIELSENTNMLVSKIAKTVTNTSENELDLITTEHLEETETGIDLTMNNRLLTGNMKELRQHVTDLLIAYIDILNSQKEIIDISYEEIQDRVFKLKEKEKDMVTDRLKNLTDEERNTDTILKINKLGQYSKGLQKGLKVLDKDFYDEERDFRDEMTRTEQIIRKKNKGVTDENIDILINDYMEQMETDKNIEDDAYDMSYMNEDYYNGNTDGVYAPEEEGEDYDDFE